MMMFEMSGEGTSTAFDLLYNNGEDLTVSWYCGDEILTFTKQGYGEIGSW